MELTMLLSKVIGLYLVIAGLAIMFRQRYYVPVFGSFVEERLMRFLWATIELVAGLFLVVTHQEWGTLVAGLITVFGWTMVLEGALYLVLPDETVEKIFKSFNKPSWYMFGGLAALVLGMYLAVVGFGLV